MCKKDRMTLIAAVKEKNVWETTVSTTLHSTHSREVVCKKDRRDDVQKRPNDSDNSCQEEESLREYSLCSSVFYSFKEK